ncbi:MAG: hypothetical protein KDI32_03955 [Pseudomonadales bacterium]|nr:hypothetical protein [Pseudomonadales bacterium]
MGATNIRMAVLVTVVGVTLAAQLVATPVLAQDPIRPAGAGDVLPACADQPGRYDGIEQPTLNSRTCSLPPGPTARLLSAQTRAQSLTDKQAMKVSIYRDGVPADGQSEVRISIELFDADGQPLTQPTKVTFEASRGRVLTQDTYLVKEAPKFLADSDRREPGTQIMVENGVAEVTLLAPYEPGDARIRVSSGDVSVDGKISFVPDLRPALAVGIVEGVVSFSSKSSDANTPVIARDGLEDELSDLSRSSKVDDTRYFGRAAFFLKNTWRDKYLVTAALDTDKDRIRLFRDIQPDQFYPIYGDASIRGFDAQSSRRGYLRVDQDNSFLLFGDFNSEDGVSDARSLGLYSRSVTGGKHHYESGNFVSNLWGAKDSVKQVIDEQPGRGISGPYAVSSSNGVTNSEKVELIVRDRNQPSVILSTTSLARFTDYEFEPFTGRLLFRKPIPSLDERLNPVSIRVTYEVDQGGPEFWVGGVNAQWTLGGRLELGVSYALDDDPNTPYALGSANATLKLGEATTWLVETAQSERDSSLVQLESKGYGFRTELRHDGEKFAARMFYGRTTDDFDNPLAVLNQGRREASAKATYSFSDATDLMVEAIQTQDATIGADRLGGQIALGHWFNGIFHAEAGVRYFDDEVQAGAPLQNTTTFSSVYNFQTSGSLPVGAYQNGGLASGQNTTGRLKLSAKIKEKSLVYVEGEQGIDDTGAYAYGAGGEYQVLDKARLYVRHEYAKSISSLYGLNDGEARRATVFGVDSAYMTDGSVFSEYRMRDALPGREGEAAVGLRNLWPVREGLAFSTSLERVQAVAGQQGDATAVGVGVEYTARELYKTSARFEFRDDETSNTYLSTLAYTRKLSRDWSLLARNVYSSTDNRDAALGERMLDRAIVGAAFRDTDTNRWNSLMRYELKLEKDTALLDPFDRKAHVVSLHTNFKPRRTLTLSGQLAGKWVDESFGAVNDAFNAYLVSGRVMYDLTEHWDAGFVGSVFDGEGARQLGLGFETGYSFIDNLWLSVGYNFSGFSDDDLVDSDYTRRGAYIRLRFKFDEKLFSGRDRSWNNSLER